MSTDSLNGAHLLMWEFPSVVLPSSFVVCKNL